MRGQLLPSFHQRSHWQGLLDGSRQDEHGEVVLEEGAPGEEIHDVAWQQQGRDGNCSHSQLHAERCRLDHPSVMEAKIALVPGAPAPRDDTFALPGAPAPRPATKDERAAAAARWASRHLLRVRVRVRGGGWTHGSGKGRSLA